MDLTDGDERDAYIIPVINIPIDQAVAIGYDIGAFILSIFLLIILVRMIKYFCFNADNQPYIPSSSSLIPMSTLILPKTSGFYYYNDSTRELSFCEGGMGITRDGAISTTSSLCDTQGNSDSNSGSSYVDPLLVPARRLDRNEYSLVSTTQMINATPCAPSSRY